MYSIQKIRRIRQVGVVLAALVIASTCIAQDSLLTYKGADRTEKLIEAAKKEGSLTLYTSISQKDLLPLVGPFEKKYGIPVKVWRSSSENVLQRTATEAKAKRYDVDVVHTTSVQLESLSREKLLQAVDTPIQKNLMVGALPPHREWAASFLAVWVQAYNTGAIKKEDLPKTYEDLLDPKWKGKLGIEGDIPQWYSAIVKDMGEKKGLKFFSDLVKQNGISVRKGHSLLNNLVVSGEVPLALTVYNYMPETSKLKGAPIDWFVIEPAVAMLSGVAVVRRAPHPNAALLFYEYMLSEDAQKILLTMNYVPTNTTVPSALRSLRITLLDAAESLEEAEKWRNSFEDVVKQGRH